MSILRSKPIAVIGSITTVTLSAYSYWAYSALRDPHSDSARAFEKWAPFGEHIVERMEERRYQRKLQQQIHQAKLTNGSASNSVTSIGFAGQHLTIHSGKKPDITAAPVDPLAAHQFFDARSGSAQSREYLPLILLPDTTDNDINEVVMALNDLIQSRNSSAITRDSIMRAAESLKKLAKRHSSSELRQSAQDLTTFSNNLPLKQSDIDAKRLSDVILTTENLLVNLVNTR